MSEAAPAVSSAESRIDRRFAALRAEGRAGLVTFVTAGDPDRETATEILRGLPAAGAGAPPVLRGATSPGAPAGGVNLWAGVGVGLIVAAALMLVWAART